MRIDKVKEVANLEFINLCHKNTNGKFSFLRGVGEICITDHYECFKRKNSCLKKENLMTHFKCYQQSEMTGNTRWANSRHSMC